MSFFRNIRSSITRGRSSSRDTTPVRASTSKASSRPSSVVSNTNSCSIERRRDSADSYADSVLNRGETFILGSDQDDKSQSNSSTLEKKSKKSKVLSKFSTFTKRKKTPPTESETFEHHPSDNATNTYYKWNSVGSTSTVDYDAQSDPFNFLYEKHSNLKLLQNGIETTDNRCALKNQSPFDSATYRKGKATSQLKAQLEQIKTQHDTNSDLCEEDQETDAEKYKTVTLNSFRKSFRDKYLQQQKDAAYNPSWFIEVEAPTPKSGDERDLRDSKENRPGYLVFENENYRPGSRSPVRDRTSFPDGRHSRSTTRSPVKRNETFRVERSTLDTTPMNHQPSIRVEIKNSVMPHVPGRMVPVGVAKPMPSIHSNSYFRAQGTSTSTPTPYTTTTTKPEARLKTMSPQRGSYKPTPTSQTAVRPGRYQTLIQISNDNITGAGAGAKLTASPTPFNRRNRPTSTRIQLSGPNQLSETPKLSNTVGSRYSYAAPVQTTAPGGLSTYELLRKSNTKPQRLKHTYFGADVNTNGLQTATSSMPPPTRTLMPPESSSTTTRLITAVTPRTINSYQTGSYSNNQVTNKHRQQSHSPKRSTSTITFAANPVQIPNMNRQSRPVVPVQRRSRSPIKIPWR